MCTQEHESFASTYLHEQAETNCCGTYIPPDKSANRAKDCVWKIIWSDCQLLEEFKRIELVSLYKCMFQCEEV